MFFPLSERSSDTGLHLKYPLSVPVYYIRFSILTQDTKSSQIPLLTKNCKYFIIYITLVRYSFSTVSERICDG